MAKININGRDFIVEKNQKLMRFLRDELRLTSVKDGCSEGACGSCTVLVDGAARKACVLQTDSLDGKKVLTVEGLSDFEKKLYSYSFGKAGAVQCGFCIPAMVLCAKSLLDKVEAPDESQIRAAIKNNYCRCTGYAKIVAAIFLAARLKAAGEVPDDADESWLLGKSPVRLDAAEKALGKGLYADDVYMDGMCFGGAVRTPYPRARLLSLDVEAAKALPDVLCVLTAAEIPGKKFVGHIKKDQLVMVGVGEITRYLGDAVALICAKSQDALEKAKSLVNAEYEVLPAVHNPREAAAEGAPLVMKGAEGNVCERRHVSRGNADEAIRKSEFVIKEKFSTPWTEHAFLEPECAVAFPEGDGVKILSSDQSVHTTRRECAEALGLPLEKVVVENMLVGGGFGGKEDMSCQHHAALLAFAAKVPVKFKLSRAESILVHPKRHPFEMEFEMGCDKEGVIQGVKARVVSDTGAFASLGGPVLERACTHAAGPYTYQNFDIEGTAYYTNNPPAGAFRGFGVTQTCFAVETLLNMMAQKIGISPWEIRMRNAIRPGGTLPNGQIVGAETGLVETLLAIKPHFDAALAEGSPAGLACAMKNAGVGVGLPDWGRCRLAVEDDGKVHIYAGASCIGQGLGTVLVQMVCTNAPVSRKEVVYERSSTKTTLDSGDTSGSRQTLITGEACRRACEKLSQELRGKTLSDLKGREFCGEWLAATDALGSHKPNPVSHVAYGYATQLCVLDKESLLIKKIVAAHDVGKAVNPVSVEGQIEGGVVMSAGFALTERFPIDEDCKPTGKFGTLGIFRADKAPKVEPIVVEKAGLDKACGAIGIGEITSIPTAPAIAESYFQATGEREFSLPLKNTPYARK